MNKWEAIPILHDQLWLMILFKWTLGVKHQKLISYFTAHKPVILSFVLKIEKFNSPVSKSIAHNPGSMGPRKAFIYISCLSPFYFYFLSIWICFETEGGMGIPGLNILWVAAKLGNPCRGEYKESSTLTFSQSFLLWQISKPGKSK